MNEILRIVVGAIIGLTFIFCKKIEDADFLYLLDGKMKESQKWRKLKRIIIGVSILTVVSLDAFNYFSKK